METKYNNEYIKNGTQMTAEVIYKYFETFLGENIKAVCESFKEEKLEEFRQLLSYGANPCKFVNKIHPLVTGEDRKSGHIGFQKKMQPYS